MAGLMRKLNGGRFLTIAVAVAVALLLDGCGVGQELTSRALDSLLAPDPTVIEVSMEAADDLNPDGEGRPSPLVLRFYELRSTDLFENVDFFVLYEQDTSALAADVVARDEIELKPGEKHSFTREVHADTVFIAVFAAYRDLERAKWRDSLQVPLHETTLVKVAVGGTAVNMSSEPAKKK